MIIGNLESRVRQIQLEAQWHSWYAWYPVRLNGAEWAWLEHVQRRNIGDGIQIYRLSSEGTTPC